MSSITATVEVFLTRVQNDPGSEAEYEIDATLKNGREKHSRKLDAQLRDNKNYSGTGVKVFQIGLAVPAKQRDAVSLQMKMIEKDRNIRTHDFCFSDTLPWTEGQKSVVSANWSGDYDKGSYRVTFDFDE